MKNRNGTQLLIATIFMMFTSSYALADGRGYDIAARSDRTDLGFGDSEVEPVSYTHLTLPTTPY